MPPAQIFLKVPEALARIPGETKSVADPVGSEGGSIPRTLSGALYDRVTNSYAAHAASYVKSKVYGAAPSTDLV